MATVTEGTMANKKDYHIEQEEQEVDITTVIDDMFNGLIRFWWLVLIIISVCASLFYFRARRVYVPSYSAYTTFTVNTVQAYEYNANSYNRTAASQIGKVFPYILTSDVLNELVAEDLGTASVEGTIKATVVNKTNLVTLTVVSNDARKAYDILQSVIRNYPQVSEYVLGDISLNRLDESGLPQAPTNPPAFLKDARKGVLVGVAVSFLFLFFYAVTRMTVRSEDDLRKVFSIECLGSVPAAKFKRRNKGQVQSDRVVMDSKGIPSIFIESLRTIRTRVEKSARENDIKTFLVSSAIPSEGKSTIAVNLAMSLVHKERSVILMDCDMRNPSIAQTLGIRPGRKQVYDLLTGNAQIEEVIQLYKDNPKFMVIPGKGTASNTAEVINSPVARELFKKLRTMADYVIIDTPPSAVVSDAAQIARYVDGAVFVVRQDQAKMDILQEGMEMFSGTGVHMMGSILNNAVAGITSYGYGYGYGYGHYGYGKYGSYGHYGRYGGHYNDYYGDGYGGYYEGDENEEDADEQNQSAQEDMENDQ